MSATKSVYDANSLPDLLPTYYKRLFPYGPYFKWLNYGGGKAVVGDKGEFMLEKTWTTFKSLTLANISQKYVYF